MFLVAQVLGPPAASQDLVRGRPVIPRVRPAPLSRSPDVPAVRSLVQVRALARAQADPFS